MGGSGVWEGEGVPGGDLRWRTEVVALGVAMPVWHALVVMEAQEGEGIGDGGEEGLADV
uniref:Uncharacterized protein OJ1080_F08.113 n=2 Tax=Oryza sativa subsp. japonica TaxID=39947 RepID=Q8GS97_ORYSJ|nr:hypothetical protein [Oryza sativa Japonica Group]BAC20017.1 hypothetical protein [Oryza sativa Japonica Group]